MEMVGAMKGGLRVAPVPMATSIDQPIPINAREAAQMLSYIPLVDEPPSEASISGDAVVSTWVPDHTSEYFIRQVENGISLVVRSNSVFEPGTATIRYSDREVWRVLAGLMNMVHSEVRIVARVPENARVYLDDYSTAWGLGIEQSLSMERFLVDRYHVNPSQICSVLQVMKDMPAEESVDGSIEICFVGDGVLRLEQIPKYILQDVWGGVAPQKEEE